MSSEPATDFTKYVGSLVFFKCPKRSWIAGVLENYDGAKKLGTCKATRDGGDTVAKLKPTELYPAREESMDEDVDDLLLMTELHDSTLLDTVRRRYFKDVIYTNIGAIVVALNPFKYTIPRYLDTEMPKYLAEGDIVEKNLPHSWACAHNTYHEMRNEKRNQSILVSGESGAGKTEASKIVMKYLGALSAMRGTDKDKEAALAVGSKINLSSPALEAFGNAKTVRNDNSSRFGKFMVIKFDSQGFLIGANITKYLLEKSRIITAGEGERIYHSFYLLLRSRQCREKFGLGEDKKYRTVNAGHTLKNKEFDTEEEYTEVTEAMTKVGIPSASIESMFKVLAGILNFENVDFVADGEGCNSTTSSADYITNGCRLWSIDQDRYEEELRETVLTIMGKPVHKLMNVAQAMDARSALDKTIYDMVFSWLVDQCNKLLDCDGEENWIGLLDIFGFEDFKVNSFEQLCINLTNETLQNHYNNFIFCKDIEECRKEGVDMSGVPFPDNTPCLQLMIAKGGVLSLLDEECQLGSGNDQGFYDKVCSAHASHPFFEVPRLAKGTFTIKHYAGDVAYTITDFREKNLDTLKDAWKLICRASKDPFIAQLLPEPVETKGPKVTVGGFFKRQLDDLMSVINSTNPHWIRCIKPHPAKKPAMFDGPTVLNQLSSSGVLGTVKVRKAGYAVRFPRDQFVAQFKIIAVSKGKPTDPQSIIDCCGYTKAEAQVGTKRVFFRSHVFQDIDLRRKSVLSGSAQIVQAHAHGTLGYLAAYAAVLKVHGKLIDALRDMAKKKVAVQRKEIDIRDELMKQQHDAKEELKRMYRASREAARDAEAARLARIAMALQSMHRAQQDDLSETEDTYRGTIISEWESGFGIVASKWATSFQVAAEKTARREHKESEKILMRDRRAMREQRREREIEHMVDKSAKRLDPTFSRMDRSMHAVQQQARAREEEAQEATARAEAGEKRRLRVETRVGHKIKEQEDRRKQQQLKRWQTDQQMARSKVAFERWERVQREDFEWQRLEQQLLKGQQLAFEEQRRVFLREKGEQEKSQRKALRSASEEMRAARAEQLRHDQQMKDQEKKAKETSKKRDEKKVFNALSEFRHEMHMRERAKAQERSIAWDNDRRERMLLQRPDVPAEALDKLPLAQRVAPPEPFAMVGGNPTYSKTWTPFKVVKLVAAPSNGVALGRPFVVCWMCTRVTQSCQIVVRSGNGEIGRARVRTAVGEASFNAPTEWFSELEIEFIAGDQVLRDTRLPKATS